MAESGMSVRGRVATSIVGAPLGGVLSYFVAKVCEAWGILDDVATGLGKYLKVHVAASDVGWVVGLIAFAALYGLLLSRVWRPTHIHHQPLQAQTAPVASATVQKIPAQKPKGAVDYAQEEVERALRAASLVQPMPGDRKSVV